MKDTICELTGHQTLFENDSLHYGYCCWCETWSAYRRFYRIRRTADDIWWFLKVRF